MSSQIITGNRLERLVAELSEDLRRPLADPLAPEIIIVQSKAMERWLALQLADRLGICANTLFDFPNAVLSDLLRRVVPGQPETSPFEPEPLAWKIMKLLPACIADSVFAPVRAYLQQATPRMQYQLAGRIADAFDQYLVFRPDMIRQWESGACSKQGDREEAWQAALWRTLVQDTPVLHRAALVGRFFELLAAQPEHARSLPQRLSVFGISYLPPFHMHFFSELGRYVDVRLYLVNPCREYWGDIVSDRQAARLCASGTRDAGEQYFERGHSLLAAWGAHGREFFDLATEAGWQARECFDEAMPGSVLEQLQADMLQLIDRSRPEVPACPIDPHDRSIRIHSCHSPMREIEVLRDNLIDLFAADRGLRPDDVLVITPDIQLYAPHVQAVFGTCDEVALPFSIADRSMPATSSLCAAFLALVKLPAGRFRVSDILPIVECPAVQRRFGFAEADVEQLQRWIAETRICWGIDAADRKRAGLPPFPQNTWAAGLDRLLLGYAMDAADGVFAGVLPLDGIEGDAARLAGTVAECIDQLMQVKQRIAAAHTLAQWSAVCLDLLKQFFDPEPEDAALVRSLQRSLRGLAACQALADYAEPVSYELLVEVLEQQLGRSRHAAGFFSGGITFCELLPMRSIPFRVICLIGMSDRAFPRQAQWPGFHLMQHAQRPCDRMPPKDDRYLFLEALLSAREVLYISYTGQSQQDNSRMPPSVLVSELVDCLEQCFCMQSGPVQSHVEIIHYLQPFNEHYFQSDPQLPGYSAQQCACAVQCAAGGGEVPAFFETPLPAPEDVPAVLPVAELARFFRNPAAYVLASRLDVRLEPGMYRLEEREAFGLSGLERYQVEQALLGGLLSGADDDGLFETCAASGLLPHGAIGRAAYTVSRRSVENFLQAVQDVCSPGACRELQLEHEADTCMLTAHLECVTDRGLLRFRHARIKPEDLLRIWFDHLLLCCSNEVPEPESVLAGLGGKGRAPGIWRFGPVADPDERLAEALALYREGQCSPLPFLPRASLAYAAARADGKPAAAAQSAAAQTFAGGTWSRSELDDVYFGRFFSEAVVETEAFSRCALLVYGPLLEHRTEMK